MVTKAQSLILFILALALDQLTKIAVDLRFDLYDIRPIIGEVLCLQYIRNSGAAFGMKYGNATVMLVVTSLVTAVLIYLYLSGKLELGTKAGGAAIVLVIAGAVGNLIDRIRLGEVIDFIDMGFGSYRWPTYNVADIYVTVGMIVLMFHFLFLAKAPGETEKSLSIDSRP